MTLEQATALARLFADNLVEVDANDTLTRIEVKEMADGSGHWAVFAETYDVAGYEAVYRTVVDAAGNVVGTESESI